MERVAKPRREGSRRRRSNSPGALRERSAPRIGVVTAFPSEDWHSARLVSAVRERGGEPVVIDPATFALGLSHLGLAVVSARHSVLELDAR